MAKKRSPDDVSNGKFDILAMHTYPSPARRYDDDEEKRGSCRHHGALGLINCLEDTDF